MRTMEARRGIDDVDDDANNAFRSSGAPLVRSVSLARETEWNGLAWTVTGEGRTMAAERESGKERKKRERREKEERKKRERRTNVV